MVAALAVLVLAAVFSPIVQTWYVESSLNHRPGVHATIESVAAGLSDVEITNLRLEFDGGVLTLPSLKAKLPVKAAVWNHEAWVGTLVAKGWTLDLTHRPTAGAVAAPGAAKMVAVPTEERGVAAAAPTENGRDAVRQFARTLRRLVSGWELPGAISLDGADLEGDILFALAPGDEPARVHLTIKGGGLAAGQTGDFAFDATGSAPTTERRLNALSIHGRLAVGMNSARTFNRIEYKGSVSSLDGLLPEDLLVTAAVAAVPGHAQASALTLDLARGDRHVVALAATFPGENRRLAGTWKLDLREADVGQLFPDSNRVPAFTATGDGRFDTDPALAHLHASGRWQAAARRLEALAPPFANVGAVTLTGEFDAVQGIQSLHVDRLDIAIAGARPVAMVHLAQPFDFVGRTGELKPENPAADWWQISLKGLPLAWLPTLPAGIVLAGGDATGDVSVGAANGGFQVRGAVPLTATGVMARRADRVLGLGLDLSLILRADYSRAQGWKWEAAPLIVARAGRQLARLDFNLKPDAAMGRGVLAMAGTWSADLEALAAQPENTGVNWWRGRSASGHFAGKLAGSTELKGKLTVVGHDPAHTVTVSGSGFVDYRGAISFNAPVRVAFGKDVSVFTAEGSWMTDRGRPHLELTLTAVKVAAEQLEFVAAALPIAGSASLDAVRTAWNGGAGEAELPRGKDRHPFWGTLTGQVRFDFYEVTLGGRSYNKVAGLLEFTPASITLKDGHGTFLQRAVTKIDAFSGQKKTETPAGTVSVGGEIAFDGAAELPYRLKGTAAIDRIDTDAWFGATVEGKDPVIEGRWNGAVTFAGDGVNLADLAARRKDEFKLEARDGIIRLLKTSVADAIPQKDTPVLDALDTVGSTMGRLFGRKEKSFSSGANPVSKPAAAVLDFTYQVAEIAFDRIAVTAVRGTDRNIRLADIELSAPYGHLTGTGLIADFAGRPLRERPLIMELRMGFSGALGKKLATAGLLSSEQDAKGFALLRRPIHFGGTLEKIDISDWQEFLAKAAATPPETKK